MNYTVTRKAIGPLPFKERLLHLPDLGWLQHYGAHEALLSIYGVQGTYYTTLSRDEVFSIHGDFSNTWLHEMEHGIIAVFHDLSALILAKTDVPDHFEVLPLVFLMPASVPFPSGHPLTGKTNMAYSLVGCGRAQLAIHPEADPDVFRMVENAATTDGEIGDLLKRSLQSINAESRAWIQTFANRQEEVEHDLPVALSAIITNPEIGEPLPILRNWLSKICTHVNRCLSSASNSIEIKVNDPMFSQIDGSIQFNITVETDVAQKAVGDALSDHLACKINDRIRKNDTPFDIHALFPRVDILKSKTIPAADLRNFVAGINAFAIVPMSNHEHLEMERMFGIFPILRAAGKHANV